MIAVSPPPSPASRFKVINSAIASSSPSSPMAGPESNGSNHNNSNRSSPSPRPSSRLHLHGQGIALPKPAQLQRLHGQGSTSNSPSPAHSPVSPSFDHLALPHYGGGGASVGVTGGGGAGTSSSSIPTSSSSSSPRMTNLYLSSNNNSNTSSPISRRTSSPPPPVVSPSSPVSTSLLFSPSSYGDNIPITTRHQHQTSHQSLPPPHTFNASSSNSPYGAIPPISSSSSSSAAAAANYTTHSLQSSPRLHSRLQTITSPRAIITTSYSAANGAGVGGSGSGSGSGSGGHGSPVFPSPGLPTARPPLTFHHTDSTSSSSGNERPSYPSHSSFSYYGHNSNSNSEREPRPVLSTAMLAGASSRSATRSPPPLTSTSSTASSFYAHSSSNSYYPYRASSPDSISSSAFAYTASNTTNSLSHAFHSALQQQQQQQQQSQQAGQGQAGQAGQGQQQGSALGLPSRQQTGSTLSTYSRPAGSSASLASSSHNLHASSVASSRHASRRPSVVTLQSFLEGVNHVTRVRSPSLRGHSRSGSFDDFSSIGGGSVRSASVLSLSSNRGGDSRPWHLDDVDEVPSWEEHNKTFSSGYSSSRAVSPTPRNRSYLSGPNGPGAGLNARHRNGSAVSIRRDLYTPDGEYGAPAFGVGGLQTSPQPIAIGGSRRNDSYDEEYDEYAERTFVDRRDMTLFPDHIRDEDEQRHLRNLNEQQDGIAGSTAGIIDDYSNGSSNHPADMWSEQDLMSLLQGDRIGVGLTHEGHLVVDALIDTHTSTSSAPNSPFKAPDDGIQFEVVRQLGYGSYAIVYLVKEVLYEPEHDAEEDPLFHTSDDDAASFTTMNGKTVYGREFALKCLSKRNLTDEQIAVQKFEATLHRALPNHPNVVALHRAMETPAWLFLVLEYCPGQDLFFWLEQARDHDDIELDPSRAPSRMSSIRAPLVPPSIMQKSWHHHGGGGIKSAAPSPPLGQSPHFSTSFDEKEATPPSPSLLSANADTALLSRRRLRLISRMFVQMCEALQACHDAGVSHRDIKPENIIIVDNRAELGSAGKVVIKITDWGLGTTDERCEDFDCGSKPYMAYECRNNLMPSYEPKGADVWSLGIVLLNLLFHRCPWADPTLDDPDFCAFRRDPVHFLETRFEGIGSEVANFLANRVFCDVEEIDSSPESIDAPLPSSVATATPFSMRRGMPRDVRVTAGEFGKWANKLVRYMGEGSRRASISDSTRQIVQTVRQSPRIDGGRAFQSPPIRSPRTSFELQRPSAIDGSPSRKNKRLSIGLPNDLMEELEKVDSSTGHKPPDLEALKSAPEHSSPLSQSLHEGVANITLKEPTVIDDGTLEAISGGQGDIPLGQGEHGQVSPEEIAATEVEGVPGEKEKSRRRKRGARKGKGHHREKDGTDATRSRSNGRGDSAVEGEVGPDTESGVSPESPNLDIVDTSKTLQAYAREISQTTKPPLVTSASYTPGLISESSVSHRHRASNSAFTSTPTLNEPKAAPAGKSRFADKLKNAFANGNPELQAFAARAKERDMALTGNGERNPTSSAPAKMQHATGSYQHPSSQLSSFGSVASSTGSWSEDGAAGKHWASTGSRRTRVDKTRRLPEAASTAETAAGLVGSLPTSRPGRHGMSSRHQYASREQASTTGSSPSPSRRSFTPLSSFSSATSYESRSVAGHTSTSPSGLAASSRTPLSSIDERSSAASSKEQAGTDDEHSGAPTPLARSTILDIEHRHAKTSIPSHTPQVIREPRPPPMDAHSPDVHRKLADTVQSETSAEVVPVAPSASRVKIGKFFNKFSRG